LRVLLACLLALLPLLAQAGIGFDELARLAAAPERFEGAFRQQKYLAELDTSLESSGRFSFERDRRIRWQILEPIHNELLITPDGISSSQDGEELLRLDAAGNPGVAIVGEILFAVLSAQWPRLEQYFDLTGEIDGSQWHAVLRPRDAAIGQLFERIELRGAQLPREIVLFEKGGDRTTIRLDVAAP